MSLVSAPGKPSSRPRLGWVVGALVVGYVGLFLAVLPGASYDLAGSLAVTPLLVVAGGVLAGRLAAREEDPVVARIMRFGYGLRLVAAALYYVLVFVVSGGDAAYYHERGHELANAIWAGRAGEVVEAFGIGTPAMEVLSGLVHAVIGPTSTGAFVVFATLSFAGTHLFLRAFRLAVPDGDARLFAKLAFLLPSMLFWPAALGKDAWMLLGLGLLAYGAARLLSGRRGVVPLVAGVVAAGLIRPHMAALSLVALVVAPLARPAAGRSPRSRRARVVLIVVLLVAGSGAVVAAMRLFGLTTLAPGRLDLFFDMLGEQTSLGGSEFTNLQTLNPLLAPVALAFVLFRPLPFEASSALMLLSSLEGVALAAIVWHQRRRLAAALRAVPRNGYVAFAVAYTVLFGLAYSYFNNLGLLARERVQVLPLLFVLLAHAPRRRHAKEADHAG